MVEKEKIGIVGLGLIGASIAAALHPYYETVGVDVDEMSGRFAQAHGLIDAFGDRTVLRGCRTVFLCTPISIVSETIREVYSEVGDTAILTDVAGIKTAVMENLPAGVRFVGGHPMAGREKSGARNYSPRLFENAIYILTTENGTREEDAAFVAGLVRRMGAIPHIATAGEHDRAVSKTSALPHMAAYALSSVALGDALTVRLAAGSLRDMTRVAGSDPAFWAAAALANAENILADLECFCKRLGTIGDAVRERDKTRLTELLSDGASKRAALNPKIAARSPLYVDVADKVGSLARVTGVLASANINIANLRVLNSREGFGGALMLEFPSASEHALAKNALTQAGFSAD